MAESAKNQLQILIVNPDKVIFEGQAISVQVPGTFGEIVFLPGHAPLYAELVAGKIIIEEKKGSKTEKKIDGGIAKIKNNTVKILVGF